MRLLDTTYQTPEKNLALDEALLLAVESGHAPDTLRFWESSKTFVVLGTAQKLAEEVHEVHCEEDGIPILRRCTAGGCVVQGRASLNYTLAVSTERNPWARNLHESYCHILNGISAELRRRGVEACHRGTSDMAIGDLKVSGNAQRRTRGAILHHGTLLYGTPDFGAMERYLREPADRPEYRGQRRHRDFVAGLPLDKREIQEAVMAAFAAEGDIEAPTHWELEKIQELATNKYATEAWTRRR